MAKIFKKPAILIAIPIIAYFFFGLQHLTKFETADEHYWIYSNVNPRQYWNYNNGRIQQYWNAISTGDWKRTRINDKPGITLAYVAGIGPQLKFSLDTDINRGDYALSKIDKAERVSFYFRFPVLLFNGLFSVALFLLLKKLLKSDWLALLAVSLILLSPIIVGISQIVNPDSLLWEFSFAAILAYLIFLDNGAKKYAALASLFLGLSLLTKYSSVILFPFFLAAMALYFVEKIRARDPEKIYPEIRRQSLAYFLILAGALALYAVMLPDNLINFGHFMKGSLSFKDMTVFFLSLFAVNSVILVDACLLKSKLFVWIAKRAYFFKKYLMLALFIFLPLIFLIIIANALSGVDRLFLFADPFDVSSKPFFEHYGLLHVTLMQFQPTVFSLAPAAILAILYPWIKNLWKGGSHQWLIFIFSLFIAAFIAAAIQQKVLLSVRYSLMIYPILLTLAAIGICGAFSFKKRGTHFHFAVFIALIVTSAFSLWRTKPFYLNYMNVLLPKQYVISDPWGYGGYEAAQFLNALPNADKLRVWSDYIGFCVFFNGRCSENKVTMENMLRDARKKAAELPDFAYFVASRRGSMLSTQLWNELKEYYGLKLVWESDINRRPANFIRIYKTTDE